MPIETTGSVATEVPAGIQTEFRIASASFDPDGQYGPCFEIDLELNEEQYLGTTCRYWARVQQPRLDLVRKYRKDAMSDKLIAEALRERGFRFKKIEEPDAMKIGRGGNTYKILAAVEGSVKDAEAALQRCGNFDELAKVFVDGVFVGTTRLSADGKYIQLDGMEEIYPVASGALKARDEAESDLDEDFNGLDFGDDPPPPTFD
jgi:hypothetical protein